MLVNNYPRQIRAIVELFWPVADEIVIGIDN